MSNPDEEKEIRSQRHDFIKEYYKMATADLDRHLKGGWQAIAVLAGGAVLLTAGHDQKIGLPIAISLALLTSFWGAATVIDANFWSLRAIAFLSNVEAVYFSKNDRSYFNPYIGYHPPFKLMNSLWYVFWACIIFSIICMSDLLWEKRGALISASRFIDIVRSKGPVELALWAMPPFVFVWGLFVIADVQLRRLKEYREFSSSSPGPGIRAQDNLFRHVTLQPLSGCQMPAVEHDVQSANVLAMDQYEPYADAVRTSFFCVAIIASCVLVFGALVFVTHALPK
jgi:hypothetical protein